jgi:hypothetical protein
MKWIFSENEVLPGNNKFSFFYLIKKKIKTVLKPTLVGE